MRIRRILFLVITVVLASALQISTVLAQQTPPPEVEPWLGRLQLIALSLNFIAWVAVAIAWFAGAFARITPHSSMSVRRLGSEWLEWAGIGALLVAGGLTIINFIMWVTLGGGQMPWWPGR